MTRSPPGASVAGDLRVALYTDSTEYGGAERSLATLLGALPASVEATLLAVDAAILERLGVARPEAPATLLAPVRGKWDSRQIAAHARVIRRLAPHVLHANLRTAWSCQYALVGALLAPGVASVATLHSLLGPRNRRQVFLNRLTLSRLDALVAVSEAAARAVERHARLPAGGVRVVPNGVPDLPGRPVRLDVRGPVVGSVGRLIPEKRYDSLIRALPSLPEAALVLVGDGPERAALARLADELGVGGRVVFAGWQERPGDWLRAFDVFALPSSREAGSLAIVEAMLAARPVVATAVGGTMESVAAGETGLLVRPDDPEALARALRRLLDDPGLRRRLGERGRELAEQRFSPARMVDAYLGIYAEVRRPARR